MIVSPGNGMYPPRLQAIAALFAGLDESARRELLIHFAAGVGRFAPQPGEDFEFEDTRLDAECTDKVGIHLRFHDGCRFRVTLGPEVQTLTRALAAVFCEGFAGLRAEEVLALPESFITEIAGTTLVKLRSRSVFYILRRMKAAAAAAISVQPVI